MLLVVNSLLLHFRRLGLLCVAAVCVIGTCPARARQSPAAAQQPASPAASPAPGTSPTTTPPTTAPQSALPPQARPGLNVVVLDAAHGGTDLGARGTEGIRESDEVLLFTVATKKALEAQGFQVVLTREANENPSFDDRSARANAQRGAVFISVHIASTGLAGTARVYVEPDIQQAGVDSTGLIPWERAQGPFVTLSQKLGDLVQQELSKRFRGSPDTYQTAPIRQLRTTATPAIAVEISSVSVEDRSVLERMVPGVAEAIAHGVATFRPSYVVPTPSTAIGGVRP